MTYWNRYEKRVAALEAQGITRSDAQGIVDAEDMTAPVVLVNGTVTSEAALARYTALYGEPPQSPGMQRR